MERALFGKEKADEFPLDLLPGYDIMFLKEMPVI